MLELETTELVRCGQEAAAAAEGGRPAGPPSLYFMKQTIGNACGTIGMLHALGNVREAVSLGVPPFITPNTLPTCCTHSRADRSALLTAGRTYPCDVMVGWWWDVGRL